MQSANLIAFLNGDIAGHELQRQIAVEVDVWAKKLSERGRSAPITLVGATGSFDITRQGAMRLLDALIRMELSPASFAYVLDALLLSENFRWTSEAVRDLLEDLITPEPGHSIDMGHARKAHDTLIAMRAS